MTWARWSDDDLVEQALDDALRRDFSQRWIEETLDRVDRPGQSGTASLRRVLGTARPGRAAPDSRFERLIERVIVGGGLPRPVRQHPVHDATGRLLGRIDVAWPDITLGIEATSERWHGAAAAASATRRAMTRSPRHGWELLYPEWHDAIEPGPFIARRRSRAQLANWRTRHADARPPEGGQHVRMAPARRGRSRAWRGQARERPSR